MTEEVMVVNRADVEAHLIDFGMITTDTAAQNSAASAIEASLHMPSFAARKRFRFAVPIS